MEWSWGRGLAHTDPTLILLLMMINLTEVDGMVVGHVRVLRVLRVLRFPKLTQIQQDSTKKIREKLCKFVAEKKHPKKSQQVNESTGQRVIGYGGFKKNW